MEIYFDILLGSFLVFFMVMMVCVIKFFLYDDFIENTKLKEEIERLKKELKED